MSQSVFSNNGLQREIDHRTGTHFILRQQSRRVGIFLIVLLRPSPDELGKYAIVIDTGMDITCVHQLLGLYP